MSRCVVCVVVGNSSQGQADLCLSVSIYLSGITYGGLGHLEGGELLDVTSGADGSDVHGATLGAEVSHLCNESTSGRRR